MALPAAAAIQRTIFFYRMLAIPLEDKTIPVIDVKDIFSGLDLLKYDPKLSDATSRYMQYGANFVGTWNTNAGGHYRVRMSKIRRSDLPHLENSGKLKALPMAAGDGLSEPIHMQFFADDIVAAEFNFHGPRAALFAGYCAEKIPALPRFKLCPLISKSVLAELEKLADIRLLSVRIHESKSTLLAAAGNSIDDALDGIANQYGADTLELTMSAGRGKKLKGAKALAKSLLSASNEPMKDFKSFKVSGHNKDTEEIETIDLLRDKLVQKRNVTKAANHKGVDSVSMFNEMEKAYNKLRDNLKKAVALGAIE